VLQNEKAALVGDTFERGRHTVEFNDQCSMYTVPAEVFDEQLA
jgi:hypothetical protein